MYWDIEGLVCVVHSWYALHTNVLQCYTGMLLK